MTKSKVAKWSWTKGPQKAWIYTMLGVTEEQVKLWIQNNPDPVTKVVSKLSTLTREVSMVDTTKIKMTVF